MLNRNNLLRALCLLALCVLLVACAGPLDRKLVTGQGSDAYFASLNPAFAQMSDHEQKAFNWAVSDIDQDQLHARYPHATPRRARSSVAKWPRCWRSTRPASPSWLPGLQRPRPCVPA